MKQLDQATTAAMAQIRQAYLSICFVATTFVYWFYGPTRLWVPPSPTLALNASVASDDGDDAATEFYSESQVDPDSVQSSLRKLPRRRLMLSSCSAKNWPI